MAAAIPLISRDLAVPDFLAARLVPYYMIPYGVGALVYALLTKRFTYRRVLACAFLGYAIFSLLTAFSSGLQQMLYAQIGAGITAACSTPLSLMIIGDLFDKDVRGRLVGTYFGCSFFASIMGMIFMGIVPWRWLFFIPAMLGLVTAVSLYALKSDLLKRTHAASVNYWNIFQNVSIRKVFTFIFLMSALYHAVHKWYGVYLFREYGLGKEAVSFFLIVSALCGLLGQNIGGYLSDKKGRLATCFIGGIILAVGTMSLSGHYPLGFVPVILGVIAMGWTISHNSISTILTDFPDDDRPMVAGLNSSVRFVSGGLGFLLSSIFVEKSFGLTFLVIGVLFLALTLTQKFFIMLKAATGEGMYKKAICSLFILVFVGMLSSEGNCEGIKIGLNCYLINTGYQESSIKVENKGGILLKELQEAIRRKRIVKVEHSSFGLEKDEHGKEVSVEISRQILKNILTLKYQSAVITNPHEASVWKGKLQYFRLIKNDGGYFLVNLEPASLMIPYEEAVDCPKSGEKDQVNYYFRYTSDIYTDFYVRWQAIQRE